MVNKDYKNKVFTGSRLDETGVEVEPLEPDQPLDVNQYAKDRIVKHISTKFSGHGLARLIESILRVQGYITLMSDPGKDGGVDILAGSGTIRI